MIDQQNLQSCYFVCLFILFYVSLTFSFTCHIFVFLFWEFIFRKYILNGYQKGKGHRQLRQDRLQLEVNGDCLPAHIVMTDITNNHWWWMILMRKYPIYKIYTSSIDQGWTLWSNWTLTVYWQIHTNTHCSTYKYRLMIGAPCIIICNHAGQYNSLYFDFFW